VPSLALREGYPERCLTMPDYCTQYGASAWLLTKEQIGQNLRECYQSSKELPISLLQLALGN